MYNIELNHTKIFIVINNKEKFVILINFIILIISQNIGD